MRVLEMSTPPARTYFHIDIGAQFAIALPQHFLYFFPDPHGHGSFRPTLGVVPLLWW